jgi:non-heme chloroperoxidase
MLDTTLEGRRAPRIEHPGTIQTADGVSLFFRDWGAGKPLLFLSGWTLNSLMWAYQMEPLARDGMRCIAYDRRAHGRSSDPGRGYDFDTLADDLASVIEALDLDDVTLVAHSFSSGEVVRYLSRHGSSRIAGAVFVAAAAIPFLLKTDDNPGGVDGVVFDQLRGMLAEDFPHWAESQAEDYFAGTGSRGIINATLGMMNLTSHQAMLEMSRIQPITDFRIELQRLTIPTLFVHGDRDTSAPLQLTSVPASKLVPGAKLTVYEGGPHGLYFTHKERLNREIAEFVRGQHVPPHQEASLPGDLLSPGTEPAPVY